MRWVLLAIVTVFVARRTGSGLWRWWELRARKGRTVIRHDRDVLRSKGYVARDGVEKRWALQD
jgi:hypothetical protein